MVATQEIRGKSAQEDVAVSRRFGGPIARISRCPLPPNYASRSLWRRNLRISAIKVALRMVTLGDVRTRYGLRSDAEVFDALTAGETLPALLYVAPEVHQLEQEKIFARAWQYACHESHVSKPGDVFLTKSGEIPIMIVCGTDGELRGF